MKLAQLISLSILVILVENLILEKVLKRLRFPRLARGRRAFAETGLMLETLTLPTAALSWLIGSLLPDGAAMIGRCAVLVLLPAAEATLGIVLMRKAGKAENTRPSREPGYRLTVCAVNCIPLGLWQLLMTDLYSRGLGITLLGALLLAAIFVTTGVVYESLRQRQTLCDCPACLRGLPLELVTAALLVMAVWGLA